MSGLVHVTPPNVKAEFAGNGKRKRDERVEDRTGITLICVVAKNDGVKNETLCNQIQTKFICTESISEAFLFIYFKLHQRIHVFKLFNSICV